MLKNVKCAKICKISLHICDLDFMNRIYTIPSYNFGCAKKTCKVVNTRALVICKKG